MKNQFILCLGFLFITLASSCTKNLSVHKRRYSEGYYVSISDKKSTKVTPHETTLRNHRNKIDTELSISSQKEINNNFHEKEFDKVNPAKDTQFNHKPLVKSKSANKPLSVLSKNELENNSTLNFQNTQKTKRIRHHNTTPYNGFFFDQSSNAWFAIGGIIAFLTTIIIFIFLFTVIGAVTISLPYLFPIFLIIGLIILLTLGVLLLVNAS